jgi:hypothetical protein
MIFQPGEFSYQDKEQRKVLSLLIESLLSIPSLLCYKGHVISVFQSCVEISSLCPFLTTNTSLTLFITVIAEGKRDTYLQSIHYLELKFPYVLWNHSSLIPLFTHNMLF